MEGKRKTSTFVEYWKLQRIGDTFYLDDVRQKEDVNRRILQIGGNKRED